MYGSILKLSALLRVGAQLCLVRGVPAVETDMQPETVGTKKAAFATEVVGRTPFIYNVGILKQSSLFLCFCICLLTLFPILVMLLPYTIGGRGVVGEA